MRAWILSLLLSLVHHTPWSDRLPEMADAIATVSEEAPLWPGEEGPRRTAAVLVALAFAESRFDPDAIGDHGQSHGAFQISLAHAPKGELHDPLTAARHARRLLAQSFRICADRPLGERMAWYAAGGPSCSPKGYAASRYRMSMAAKLLRGAP